MGQRQARSRRAGAEGSRVDDAVRHSSGRVWTSLVGSALVAGSVLIGVPRGRRREHLREWRSFWSVDPRISADQVHFEVFISWIFFAYPLVVVTALVGWGLSAAFHVQMAPGVFFGLVSFALASGALNFALGRRVHARTTRAAQVLAGWPQELASLAVCLVAALIVVRP